MHEEPYAQALLDLALEACHGRSIARIDIEIGRFSAIVPDSLAVFFSCLSRGTAAEGAELVFETVPVVLTCKACGSENRLDIPETVPVRPALARHLAAGCICGAGELSVTGGLGLELTGIDVC